MSLYLVLPVLFTTSFLLSHLLVFFVRKRLHGLLRWQLNLSKMRPGDMQLQSSLVDSIRVLNKRGEPFSWISTHLGPARYMILFCASKSNSDIPIFLGNATRPTDVENRPSSELNVLRNRQVSCDSDTHAIYLVNIAHVCLLSFRTFQTPHFAVLSLDANWRNNCDRSTFQKFIFEVAI